MSTSTKTPASIRQGGPGASHENARAPLDVNKPPPLEDGRKRSKVSGAAANATATIRTSPDARAAAAIPSVRRDRSSDP